MKFVPKTFKKNVQILICMERAQRFNNKRMEKGKAKTD